MPSWHLEDADKIAAENKYTFYKPSRAIIQMVQVGEFVKLSFPFESDDPEAPGGERMLVLVDEVADHGVLRGRLGNSPRFITDLKFGDTVTFQACHIIGTEHDPKDNLVERYLKRCVVSNRILRDGAKIGFLCRDEPLDNGDSGWTMTADDESGEYIDDPDNMAFVSQGAVLRRDDSIVDLLDAPVGSAFFRNAETDEFIPLVDEDCCDDVCISCRALEKEALVLSPSH